MPTTAAPPTLSFIGCPCLRTIKLGRSNDGFPPRHTEPHGTLSKFSRQRIAISTEERWSPVHLINYINIFRDVSGACHRADTNARRVKHANRESPIGDFLPQHSTRSCLCFTLMMPYTALSVRARKKGSHATSHSAGDVRPSQSKASNSQEQQQTPSAVQMVKPKGAPSYHVPH